VGVTDQQITMKTERRPKRNTVEQGADFLKDMDGIQDQGFHEVNYDKPQTHLRKASSIINLDHSKFNSKTSNEDQFDDVDLGRGVQPKKQRLDLNAIFDTPPSVDTKSTASDDTPSKISSNNAKRNSHMLLGCCGKSTDSSDNDDDASCTIS
jgi:hypothetical protein